MGTGIEMEKIRTVDKDELVDKRFHKIDTTLFLFKKRFLVKIMGLCSMSPQALKGLMCNLAVTKNLGDEKKRK